MAAGKPIILAIDGAIRDVVEKANCGFFCQPGNSKALVEAINKLQGNPVHSFNLGMNGRVYLEKNFDRKDIVNTFSKILIRLIKT